MGSLLKGPVIHSNATCARHVGNGQRSRLIESRHMLDRPTAQGLASEKIHVAMLAQPVTQPDAIHIHS
jgi:hypothetical protein